MKASLDTNVIIHFYKAGCQQILFDFFRDGVFIYEQIRDIELEHHGVDILDEVDKDINSGKIEVYTNRKLKELAVDKIFDNHVKDNKNLYTPRDMGEVYAISLAQTLGAYSFVTDDIKQGGPYVSLLQFGDEVMPFNFADVLLLRFLLGGCSAKETVTDFDRINEASGLKWSLKGKLRTFINRFWKDTYRKEDMEWINGLLKSKGIKLKDKFVELNQLLDR